MKYLECSGLGLFQINIAIIDFMRNKIFFVIKMVMIVIQGGILKNFMNLNGINTLYFPRCYSNIQILKFIYRHNLLGENQVLT